MCLSNEGHWASSLGPLKTVTQDILLLLSLIVTNSVTLVSSSVKWN